MDAVQADDGPTKTLPSNAFFDDDDEVDVKPKPVVTTQKPVQKKQMFDASSDEDYGAPKKQ